MVNNKIVMVNNKIVIGFVFNLSALACIISIVCYKFDGEIKMSTSKA